MSAVAYGALLNGEQRFDEARPLLAHSVAAGAQTLPADSRVLARRRVEFGRCLIGLGETQLAAEQLRQAHVVLQAEMRDAYPEAAKPFAEATQMLVEVLTTLGDTAAALNVQQESQQLHSLVAENALHSVR